MASVNPPRGMRDFLPAEKARRERVLAAIRERYRAHGFDEIETPVMEEYARLHAGIGGDNEKLAYTVLRRGLSPDDIRAAADDPAALSDLGLRYDLTVPLARFYASHRGELPGVFRAIQIAPVWRAERPQKGRYRQFVQCDIDVLGDPTARAEAELAVATLDTLDALGLQGGTIRINDRRMLDWMLDSFGFAPAERPGVLITLDKLDKIGVDGVAAALRHAQGPEGAGQRSALRHAQGPEGAGQRSALRQDQGPEGAGKRSALRHAQGPEGAGQRSALRQDQGPEGAGQRSALRQDQGPEGVDALVEYLGSLTGTGSLSLSKGGEQHLRDALPAGAPDDVIAHLVGIAEAVAAARPEGAGALVFDPFLVRGMGYYTGTIFELAHPAVDYSLGGGGRYDGMVGRFLGQDVPAVGFSIGFERIVELITDGAGAAAPAVVLVHDADVPVGELLAHKAHLVDEGARVRLERRTKNLKALLDRAFADGYTAFATVARGQTGLDVTPLS